MDSRNSSVIIAGPGRWGRAMQGQKKNKLIGQPVSLDVIC